MRENVNLPAAFAHAYVGPVEVVVFYTSPVQARDKCGKGVDDTVAILPDCVGQGDIRSICACVARVGKHVAQAAHLDKSKRAGCVDSASDELDGVGKGAARLGALYRVYQALADSAAECLHHAGHPGDGCAPYHIAAVPQYVCLKWRGERQMQQGVFGEGAVVGSHHLDAAATVVES